MIGRTSLPVVVKCKSGGYDSAGWDPTRFAAMRRPYDDAVSGDTKALRGAAREVLEAGEWSMARTAFDLDAPGPVCSSMIFCRSSLRRSCSESS